MPWIINFMKFLQRWSLKERLSFDSVYEKFLNKVRACAVRDIKNIAGTDISQYVAEDGSYLRHNSLILLTASHRTKGHFLIGSHKDAKDCLG